MRVDIVDVFWLKPGTTQGVAHRPFGPVAILVHIASVWVPFTSESKEAVAAYPEILKEIKLAQVLGRPIYQIVPYGVSEPHVIPGTGRIVPWDWDAIRRTLVTIPRH